jgi:hypothetical protein
VARKHGRTNGRISQLRRTLENSWLTFQQEAQATINIDAQAFASETASMQVE